MRNTRFDTYLGIRMPKEVQKKRIQQVIREEMTELQRHTFLAYYIQERSILEIARERGVNKSTVWRTLCRAEQKLRAYLKY